MRPSQLAGILRLHTGSHGRHCTNPEELSDDNDHHHPGDSRHRLRSRRRFAPRGGRRRADLRNRRPRAHRHGHGVPDRRQRRGAAGRSASIRRTSPSPPGSAASGTSSRCLRPRTSPRRSRSSIGARSRSGSRSSCRERPWRSSWRRASGSRSMAATRPRRASSAACRQPSRLPSSHRSPSSAASPTRVHGDPYPIDRTRLHRKRGSREVLTDTSDSPSHDYPVL